MVYEARMESGISTLLVHLVKMGWRVELISMQEVRYNMGHSMITEAFKRSRTASFCENPLYKFLHRSPYTLSCNAGKPMQKRGLLSSTNSFGWGTANSSSFTTMASLLPPWDCSGSTLSSTVNRNNSNCWRMNLVMTGEHHFHLMKLNDIFWLSFSFRTILPCFEMLLFLVQESVFWLSPLVSLNVSFHIAHTCILFQLAQASCWVRAAISSSSLLFRSSLFSLYIHQRTG